MFKTAVILNNFAAALLILQFMLHWNTATCAQPSYQVSLYLHVNFESAPIHYCNGVIVQRRLILTAASCTYYKKLPNGPVVNIDPQRISVVAGAYNKDLDDRNTFKVEQFLIAKGFNKTTLVNDIALLRLAKYLPLGTRKDINWIILDEYDPRYDSNIIQASFPSLNWNTNYTQMESLPLLKSKDCAVRPNDICTKYTGDIPNVNCQSLFEFPELNGDRGTGLVSKSHLIGIFSTIADKNVSCRNTQPTIALFTNLSTHLDWIYNVIANDEYMTSDDNNALSAPYNEPEIASIRQMRTIENNTDSIPSDNGTTKNHHYQALTNAGLSNVKTTQCKYFYFALNTVLCVILVHNYNS